MLILAAGDRGLPLDYSELERWTRVGYERGMASRRGDGESVTSGVIVWIHQCGSFSVGIVGPRPRRLHVTLDNPRERSARPVGSSGSDVRISPHPFRLFGWCTWPVLTPTPVASVAQNPRSQAAAPQKPKMS
jgi:hypothetical protein